LNNILIQASSLTKTFEERKVLNKASFHLTSGEFVAITGKSGVGKSTLLGILGALDPDFKGNLLINQIDVKKADNNKLTELRRVFLGFIFQDFHLLPNLPAIDNILLPAIFSGSDSKIVRDEAADILKRLELRNDDTPTRFLSRGERQRVATARALINNPKVLIADEPTASLDEDSEANLFDLLDGMRKEKGFALLAVLHSKTVLSRADRVLNLEGGVLNEKHA